MYDPSAPKLRTIFKASRIEVYVLERNVIFGSFRINSNPINGQIAASSREMFNDHKSNREDAARQASD